MSSFCFPKVFFVNFTFKILGASRTDSGVELLYARQKMVLVAKAFGLQAIDFVNINYKDLVKLETDCIEGALMGYTGTAA